MMRRTIDILGVKPNRTFWGRASMAHVPMPPNVPLDRDLPNWLRLAVADAIIVSGRIEQEAIEIAWLIFGADLKGKLKLSRNPAKDNIISIIEFIENTDSGLNFSALKQSANFLSFERNFIAHGSWVMAGDKPFVVWHKFLEDDDSVIGEYFEQRRFDRFMSVAEQLLATLFEYHTMLEGLTGLKTSAIPQT